MELQSGISLEFNQSRVGSVERVLVDSFTDGVYVARTSKESPEVDGEVLIGGEFDPARIGTFVDAMITGANEYDLLGEFK